MRPMGTALTRHFAKARSPRSFDLSVQVRSSGGVRLDRSAVGGRPMTMGHAPKGGTILTVSAISASTRSLNNGYPAPARFRRVFIVDDSRDAEGADLAFSNSASTTTVPRAKPRTST